MSVTRSATKIVVVFMALIAAAGFAATGQSKAPVTINHFGVWTLRAFGYDDQVRNGTKSDYLQPRLFFGLPAGAVQGPRDWYLVHLHVRFVLASNSGPGKVVVSATTNSAACALIEFRVQRSGGHRRIAWTSVGIVDGALRGTSSNDTVELRYANYLQHGGVRPGSNELDFQIRQYGSARIAEVRFFDDSGIEFTRLGPANVTLSAARVRAAAVQTGQRFTVAVALRNRGERTARRIRVWADYPAKIVSLKTPEPIRVAALRHGASVTARLVFISRQAGTAPIFFHADTSSNHPGDLVTVRVRP